MKLTVKSDYAARAVLGLAKSHQKGVARRVEELAREQGIPPKYLTQILIELKSQQIVRSVRGKEGGYLLARPPGKVTLGDILRCFHGHVFEVPDMANYPPNSELRGAWLGLQKALETAADSIHFQALLEREQEREKMYYI